MKKILIYVLVLLMAFSGVSALGEGWIIDDEDYAIDDVDVVDENDEAAEPAEEPVAIQYDYNELTVASTTPFSGNFFARMWGNLTSDLDVQTLVHGYNLVEWDSEAGAFMVDPSVVSGLVVTQNEEGDRTYTLVIYEDLVYSNGESITTWDYAFSLLLSIAPQIAEIGGSPVDMEYIKGYREYVSGASNALAGVRVYTDQTMAITISHEYLPFFYELGLLNCTPYPISVIAPGCTVRDDGQGAYISGDFTAELLRQTILDEATGYLSHPSVSSGPYRLISYDGTKVELEINENYKGNSDGITPTIPRLIYETADKSEIVTLLANGEVGLLNKILDSALVMQGQALVAQDDTFVMAAYPRTGLGYITFCCEQKTVSSAAVRQALSYCLDKDALAGETVSNFGLRVNGYYGLGQWMYQLLSGTIPYPVKEPEAGATAQEIQEYEEELKAWEELTMDDVPVYDPDAEAAVALLEADGWTLNRNGEPFDAAQDDVRCKLIDGELVALELTMLCPQENGFGQILQDAFVGLDQVGAKVTVVEQPMNEVLLSYYREAERDCDMIFMASNFDVVFDPSISFMPDGDEPNPYNFSAIDDEELYQLAVDMRMTEPEEVLEYVTKWVAFQTRLQEVAPIISIYSSVYFDFYPRVLQDYNVSSNVTWSQAIVYAYLGDVPEQPATEGGTEEIDLGEGEFIFD